MVYPPDLGVAFFTFSGGPRDGEAPVGRHATTPLLRGFPRHLPAAVGGLRQPLRRHAAVSVLRRQRAASRRGSSTGGNWSGTAGPFGRRDRRDQDSCAFNFGC